MRIRTPLTSVLDPEKYPARESVALHHERWAMEFGDDEVKTDMLERQETIHGKTPRSIAQERWAVRLADNQVPHTRREQAGAKGRSPLTTGAAAGQHDRMVTERGSSSKERQPKPSRPTEHLRRQRMMGIGRRSHLHRDWLLGALQEHLQFRARVAEHYREELYNRLSDIERMSERLDYIDTRETRDRRPRQGGRPPVDFPHELPHERWAETRRHAANWWEDRLRLWAEQIDIYVEFLHTRADRIRELRKENREEAERRFVHTRADRRRELREENREEAERKAEAAATPDASE